MQTDFSHLPVFAESDVCVLGGGPSGVAAAISAARTGARVLLVEKHGFLGGAGTASQVPAFAPFSDRTKSIVRGLGWEVLTQMLQRTGRIIPDPDVYAVPQDAARMDWVPIDVEVLKTVYDDLCEGANVRVLFHSVVPDVIKNAAGNEIESVVLANKNGLTRAKARVFVDATGDADLAARAGCPFAFGDEDGRAQGMTLCFTVANGSREKYLNYVHSTGDGYLANLIALARKNNDYDLPDASLVGLSFKNETVAGANMGHVYGHAATNAQSLSDAEREGRRILQKLIPFLRKYVPGQENLTLVSSGPQIGVRESRRIIGDYVLTVHDYLSRRTFPDDIARNAYFLDLHAVTSESAARAKSISDTSAASDKAVKKSFALAPGESHGIPYRCLIPQAVENLLVAGRCLSADRAVQGAARVMPVCFALGEAAGIASAFAAQHDGHVRGVNVSRLQAELRNRGAYLP